ncbi:MAG: VWA domain-containing protein [Pseudomonadota bacterium]
MSRRLPVYLLIDTSASMTGEPIEAVKTGLDTLVSALRTDPQALETAWLSLITFDSEARELVPLTELIGFQVPPIEARGVTAYGAGLKAVTDAIHRDVQKATAERKGDWKPIIFIMTDGMPTDDWHMAVESFAAAKPGLVVACAAGANAALEPLQAVTQNVVSLDTADRASLSAFFKWVSASIAVSSSKVDLTKKDTSDLGELPPPPDEIKVVI